MPCSDVHIDWIDGYCPVQAEGLIDGKPFYFRARGNSWTLEIADEMIADMAFVANWYHREQYGSEPFAAGWMTLEEARQFIHRAADIYRKERGHG